MGCLSLLSRPCRQCYTVALTGKWSRHIQTEHRHRQQSAGMGTQGVTTHKSCIGTFSSSNICKVTGVISYSLSSYENDIVDGEVGDFLH